MSIFEKKLIDYEETDEEIAAWEAEFELRFRVEHGEADIDDFDGSLRAAQAFCEEHGIESPTSFDPITGRLLFESRYNGLSDSEREW